MADAKFLIIVKIFGMDPPDFYGKAQVYHPITSRVAMMGETTKEGTKFRSL